MSNDYFKAQGWFKNYALNSQDSRGVFQQLVKEDEEEAAKLASAETDKIKEEMNKGGGAVRSKVMLLMFSNHKFTIFGKLPMVTLLMFSLVTINLLNLAVANFWEANNC